jgi:hypothetical protein
VLLAHPVIRGVATDSDIDVLEYLVEVSMVDVC